MADDPSGQARQPRQPIQSPLNLGGRDHAGLFLKGFLQGALGQMVEDSRTALGGLHDQFLRGEASPKIRP